MLTSMSSGLGTHVVAYCVLNPGQEKGGVLEKLQKFCQGLDCETEVFAEKLSEGKTPGPLWLQIVELIQSQKCNEVIVPNLHHVASGNSLQMVRFFTLLKKTGVRVRTMDEVVDSNRQSIDEIASISVSNPGGWL